MYCFNKKIVVFIFKLVMLSFVEMRTKMKYLYGVLSGIYVLCETIY